MIEENNTPVPTRVLPRYFILVKYTKVGSDEARGSNLFIKHEGDEMKQSL